jgi:hypothetical protein
MSSLFFSRSGGYASHVGRFVASIAVQLAYNVLTLKRTIRDAITERGTAKPVS